MADLRTAVGVTVENVGKRFVLNKIRTSDLRELFSLRFNRRLHRSASDTPNDFWALRDVSFSVHPGEAVGIVGHNGSGKSTLLKLLNGILKPTTGSLKVQGRVSALIEVGAGFHPDLTGRENIYLNGSILGLTHREIDKRFDEIVAFAALESFIDTPVKRYSSGMYMRLGFSIAVHVQPDILLIDEVLAVGDELFQRKCLRRMKQFVEDGGIALFVSHSMPLVASLCPRTIWLDHGQMLYDGDTAEVAKRYMTVVAEREEAAFKRERPEEWAALEAERVAEEAARAADRVVEEAARAAERIAADKETRRKNDERAIQLISQNRDGWFYNPHRTRITSVRSIGVDGAVDGELTVGDPWRLEIGCLFPKPLPDPVITMEILRFPDDLLMFATNTETDGFSLKDAAMQGTVTMDVGFMSLNAGTYRIRLQIFAHPAPNGDWQRIAPEEYLENAFEFTVATGDHAHGCAFLPIEWEVSASRVSVGVEV